MKKRVILTSNAYLPNIGGIENSLYYLALTYKDMGYEVEIVVSDLNTINNSQLDHFQDDGGIKIYRYASYQHTSLLLKPFRTFLSLFAMFRLLKLRVENEQPLLVVSRFHFNTIIAKLVGIHNITYLVPGVVKFQNTANNLSSSSGIMKFKRFFQLKYHSSIQNTAFKAADRLFIFSENMKKQIQDSTDNHVKLFLTKPGVDISDFLPIYPLDKQKLRVSLGLPSNKKVLLMVGRFVKAKGIMFALEAMRELDDYHLVLVGSGEEGNLYHDFIERFELSSSVTIFEAQADVVPFYQCADIFLMLSTYEPFGQTIIEAMACKLPVVAFAKCTGIKTATHEILPESIGLYITECNSQGVVNKLVNHDLSNDDLLRIGDASREHVYENFTWERLAQSLL